MGLIDYDLYKKTYKISDNFNKEMIRVGLLWLQEMRKPAKSWFFRPPRLRILSKTTPTNRKTGAIFLLSAEGPFQETGIH